MASDETARLDAHIPARLKEKLRQADQTQTDAVIEALEIYFGEGAADSRAAIERQIHRLREQKANAEQRRQTAEEQIEEAEASIDRLESRLSSMERTAESYEEALDDQLASMRESRTSVFSGHASVQNLAREYDTTEEQILNDLRKRSDLHESYFTEGPPKHADTTTEMLSSVGDGE